MRRTCSDLRIQAYHDEADQNTADTFDDESASFESSNIEPGIVTHSRSGVPSKQLDHLTYYHMWLSKWKRPLCDVWVKSS